MPLPGDVIGLRQHAEDHGSAVRDEDEQTDDEVDDLAQDVIGEPGAYGQIAEEAEDDARGADDVLSRQSGQDRKSTRLNSSHVAISYAVFCLKKKKKQQ